MGYFSELHAEGPYRTCGEADEDRRFRPEEYAIATAPITTRTCLFCGKPGYPSACPECMTWEEAIVPDGTDPDDFSDTEPTDPPRALVNWNSEVS